MKKITTILATATMAVFSQAAQINWGAQGQLFDGTTVMSKANGYTVSAYLVYLGGSGATWDPNFTVGTPSLAVGGDVLGTKNSSDAGTMLPTSGTPLPITSGMSIGAGSDTVVVGESTFGIVFVATNSNWDADEFIWLLSDEFVYLQTGSSWNASSETFTYSSKATNTGSVWNEGKVVVPEPATATMALAGLALLFRRKRK